MVSVLVCFIVNINEIEVINEVEVINEAEVINEIEIIADKFYLFVKQI